jgi:hypothetical protein
MRCIVWAVMALVCLAGGTAGQAAAEPIVRIASCSATQRATAGLGEQAQRPEHRDGGAFAVAGFTAD